MLKLKTVPNYTHKKRAQKELGIIYLKEQTEYIQNQIDNIRDSVEDRQSRIARQTINEGEQKEEHSQS